MADFIVDSLRGGLDDFTPVSALPKDACTVAENVEFFRSTLGERRAGTTHSDLPSQLSGATAVTVTFAYWHRPSDNPTSDELWIFAIYDSSSSFFRKTSAGWAIVNIADANDRPSTSTVDTRYCPGHIYGQSLHGKLFLAYKSSKDRLHVWDGTSVRRTGVAAPTVAPTVANTGVGAYPAVLRYYRLRWVQKSGSVVLRRSEAGPSVSFTPSGAGTAARVTQSTPPGEGETHWELEASTDNTLFYNIADIAVGTTTYDDSALVATYSSNPQSDPAGTYDLIPSVRLLGVDNDRLLTGGSWETTADDSAFRWTPVGNDPLPGPDERFDDNFDPRVDLDARDGGGLTAIAPIVEGTVYVFKLDRIYRLLRTGQLVGAYEAKAVTTARGAISRSIVPANDEAGHPAVYFLDDQGGPMRIGVSGIQYVGRDIHTLWQTRVPLVNTLIPCHGLFYPTKQQVHYWIATNLSDEEPGTGFPTAKIVLQTNEVRTAEDGSGRRGWSTVPASFNPGSIGNATCSTLFRTEINASQNMALVPFIGKSVIVANTNSIQRCDTGTTDDGVAYTARVRTRPYFLTNILNRNGALAAAVLGLADSKILVRVVRDFGTETLEFSADMTPPGSETHAIAQLDNFNVAELFAMQIEFADDPLNLTQWELLQFAMKQEAEQTA